eukprot:2268524-Prymnesium_polylepis.2
MVAVWCRGCDGVHDGGDARHDDQVCHRDAAADHAQQQDPAAHAFAVGASMPASEELALVALGLDPHRGRHQAALSRSELEEELPQAPGFGTGGVG